MDENQLANLVHKLHEAEIAIVETEAEIAQTATNDSAAKSTARALEALRSARELLTPAPNVSRSP
jgi:hypothetical protein